MHEGVADSHGNVWFEPADDPLLAAGLVECLTCGRSAYPVEAQWLSGPGGMLMAAYPRVCSHAPAPTAALVDPDKLLHIEGYDPELWLAGRRCEGKARTGRPCKADAKPGYRYCHCHGQESAAA